MTALQVTPPQCNREHIMETPWPGAPGVAEGFNWAPAFVSPPSQWPLVRLTSLEPRGFEEHRRRQPMENFVEITEVVIWHLPHP